MEPLIKMNMNKQFIFFIVIFVAGLTIIPLVTAILEDSCCMGFCILKSDSCFERSSICEYAESCQIGCCIDKNGFEHNNYPNGRCVEFGGRFYEGTCRRMSICGE